MQFDNINRYKSWLISAGIILVVTVWLMSGATGTDDEAEQTAAVRDDTASTRNAVRVRSQSAEEVMRTIVVNGKTAPSRIVHLAAETDGRIEYIGAERGASVERGGIIVRLDERDRSARLAQAEATVKQREVEYEGRLKLQSESYVSEAQLQEAIAMLEAAKAELTRARLDLAYRTIRAPFAGALQSRNVEVGDFVSRGDPVATYVDNRTIIVSANLSEFDARFVDVGDQTNRIAEFFREIGAGIDFDDLSLVAIAGIAFEVELQSVLAIIWIVAFHMAHFGFIHEQLDLPLFL